MDRHGQHPKAVPISGGMSGGGPILVGTGIGVDALTLGTWAREKDHAHCQWCWGRGGVGGESRCLREERTQNS